MQRNKVFKTDKHQFELCVHSLRSAFSDDPLWNLVFKHDRNQDKALNAFFKIPLLYAHTYGHIYTSSPLCEGVIVWVPHEKSFMGFFDMLRCGALSLGSSFGTSTMKNLSLLSKKIEPDRKRLMAGKKYNYLMLLGVTQEAQGRGYGGLLLEELKRQSDQQQRYIYLETESEDTVSFYEKHGFKVVGEIIVDGLGVPMWQMMRSPH